MSLKAKRKVVSSIPPMDGGTYMGVCVAVVDLGQQYKQFEFQSTLPRRERQQKSPRLFPMIFAK